MEVPIKEFRRGLNEFCKETLDLCKHYETKDIIIMLEDLHGTNKQNYIKKKVSGEMCYCFRPSKTIELLKTYNFYQDDYEDEDEENFEEENFSDDEDSSE